MTGLPTVSVVSTDGHLWDVRCSDASHPDSTIWDGLTSGAEAGRKAEEHLDAHRAVSLIPSDALPRLRAGWLVRHDDLDYSRPSRSNDEGYLLAIIALYELPRTANTRAALRAALNGS